MSMILFVYILNGIFKTLLFAGPEKTETIEIHLRLLLSDS